MSSAPKQPKDRVQREITRRTIISFSVFFVCIGVGIFLFSKLYREPISAGYLQPTLRKVLVANEKLFSLFYSKTRQAKAFKKTDAVTKARVNGGVGMDGVLDTATWRLKVVRNPGDTLSITLDELKALPKTEVVFDFKCVEGWSQVTWWGGVRFSDFLKKYNLVAQSGMRYVGMITPDKAYYVGNDMPSMMQPQTLLCYELNGKPLPQNQGYPLRLIIPVKYGIKHLKRIGFMYFSNEKPRDYWAELGYDYYSGL
ncbi:MAG: molybdopterin-dependent oxidoreductase [Flavipsychrobacter sp.]|nr:molybdopterin-dependent oxidoreductase [Flavipsychrobacter sp.]